jgi:MFS family permease
LISALGTGALTPLLVFFVEDNLHTKATMLGLLTMGFAAGSVLGALTAGRLVARLGARRLTWLGLVCSGLLMLVFARQNQFVPALVIFFVTALPVAALNVGLGPQLMASTPPAFLGRMMAILSPTTMIAAALSLAVSGWLTSTVLKDFHAEVLGFDVGPIDLVYSISALLILSAGIAAWRLLPERPAGSEAAAGSEAMVEVVDDEATAM